MMPQEVSLVTCSRIMPGFGRLFRLKARDYPQLADSTTKINPSKNGARSAPRSEFSLCGLLFGSVPLALELNSSRGHGDLKLRRGRASSAIELAWDSDNRAGDGTGS